MFVFRLFETVCQCLEVLVCECVCVLEGGREGGQVHMCVTMIATLHSGKTNTSRDPYIHSQGSFINQAAVHLSTHSIFLFFSSSSAWDYKVVRLCQESSRCSAKGARAMCVRKKSLNTWLWSRAGWGGGKDKGGRWDSNPRGPETERERARGTVGDWPFTRQLFSLRCLFSAYLQPPPLFFCISHYLVPWDREQDGVSVLMWQEAILHSQRKKKKSLWPVQDRAQLIHKLTACLIKRSFRLILSIHVAW